MLIIFGILGCLGLILVPIFARPGHPAYLTTCKSNIKEIGTGTALYLGDNDDRMPLEDWMDSLLPYTKNRDMMGCPFVSRYGYGLKIGVVGINASKEKDPEHTAMYFETDALGKSVVANLAARSGRHKKGSHVGYLDTHAKFVRLGDPVK